MLQENQEILEGRFKIVKKLGSGAFGEIFKGNHASTTAYFFSLTDVTTRSWLAGASQSTLPL